MACGVPVIASNAGGLPELIAHGDGGFVFPIGDTAAMAAQAIALLSDGAELGPPTRLAHRRAVEHFSTGPVVDQYEALYRRLLAPPSRLD